MWVFTNIFSNIDFKCKKSYHKTNQKAENVKKYNIIREDDVEELLKLQNITKKFGNVVANDHINLSVGRGEIRALLGENGAGDRVIIRPS